MLNFGDLGQGELLALGRRASELCSDRFDQLCRASHPEDHPVRELLRKMAFDAAAQASYVELLENHLPEHSTLESRPGDASALIGTYLVSLTKRLGEGPLSRDAALFLAESLEEEASRLYRVLAGHSRESRAIELFSGIAAHQQGNFRYLREVVLEG